MKFDEKTRGWIYRILVAAGAIVAGYGFMTGEQVAMWLGLAAVVFNTMPSANTSVTTNVQDVVDSQDTVV